MPSLTRLSSETSWWSQAIDGNKRVKDRVRTVLANVLGVDENTITDQTTSSDIEQWDSILHLSLVLSLEEEFQVEFQEEQIGEITSFSKIVDALGSVLGNSQDSR